MDLTLCSVVLYLHGLGPADDIDDAGAEAIGRALATNRSLTFLDLDCRILW